VNLHLFPATTDRRPVDPPPVVQLQIFEHSKSEPKTFIDITQYYPANFFVYVTLESEGASKTETARGSNGKVKQLTGTPNTGGLYLDRPDKAVFFTFGDLSVRSEGLYKLRFNLYEVPFCQHLTDIVMDTGNKPTSELGFAFGRAEVHSNTFEVFSAKKFPGLAESTLLSRTLSEQGCRVRIRRDVRVRKHNGRAGTISDVDSDDEEREESEDAQSSLFPSTPATARPRLDSSDGKQSLAGSISAFSAATPAQHYQPQSLGQSRPQSSQGQQQPQAPYQTPASSTQTSFQDFEQSAAIQQPNANMQQHPSFVPPTVQYPPQQPTYQYLTHYGHGQMPPPPPPQSVPQTSMPLVYGTSVSYQPGYPPPVTYGHHYQPHQQHSEAYTYAPAQTQQEWSPNLNTSQQLSYTHQPTSVDHNLEQNYDIKPLQHQSNNSAQQQQQQHEASIPRHDDPEIKIKWLRTQRGYYNQPVYPPVWAGGPEFPPEDPRYDTSNFDWHRDVEPPWWAKENPAGSKRSFDETEDTTYMNVPIKQGDRPESKAWWQDADQMEDLEHLRNTLVLQRADGVRSTIAEGKIRYAETARKRQEIEDTLKQYEDHRQQILANFCIA